MPLQHDILGHIINVNWGKKPLAFLASFVDAMYGSKDGDEWEQLKQSVPAISLAWSEDGGTYGTWIGCSPAPNGGCWRSQDGGKSWKSCGPKYKQVAAMRRKATEEEDKEEQKPRGMFAAWNFESEESDNQVVYVSEDLGKTWNSVLTIPQSFPSTSGEPYGRDGYESIVSINGCGEKFVICTQRGESGFDSGSGFVYISSDGKSFNGRQMVFGPGTEWWPTAQDPGPGPPAKGYGTAAVAYDDQTKEYRVFGLKQDAIAYGTNQYDAIHAPLESAAGDGTSYASATYSSPSGETLGSMAATAAGGKGQFVHGLVRFTLGPSGYTNNQAKAYFVSGAMTNLESTDGTLQIWQGSYCFHPDAAKFGCASTGVAKEGGVYIASVSGAFGKKKSGTGIALVSESEGPSTGIIGLAIGKLDFEESTA